MKLSRRGWIGMAGLAVPVLAQPSPEKLNVTATFPKQAAEMVRETVLVSHGNIKRVRELVDAHPALAKAAIDWGFGDWEAAIDAASHVGNREIAEYLIGKGARPTLFSAAMLGQLDVVKAFIAAQPGVQRCPGPHSIPLLAHAKAGGAAAKDVYAYLESLGDAGSPPSVPVPEEDLQAIPGPYLFGDGPSDQIEITRDKSQLSLARKGAVAQRLLHLGALSFHPAGASAVRVTFVRAGESATLTVFDPDPVLIAKKGA